LNKCEVTRIVNSHDKVGAGNKQIPDACAISVILSTLSVGIPKYQHPERIKSSIPKGLTSEIIVVHYGYYNARNSKSMLEKSIESNNIETTDISEINNQKNYQKVVHVNVAGEFASAIIKGVELSKGQFILAVDADVDYPEEVISELIKNLMNSPNSIIIASRYAKGVAKQRLPSIRSTISKGARIIVRHGLNVKGS
jgi:glycosyltransferase involved in cell wall biosynthesis